MSRSNKPNHCPKCNGEFKDGIALSQTYTGVPDFIGGDIVTVSPGGSGKLIDVLKCGGCGFSVSK